MRSCWATSATIVRLPWRAATSASAAATVVRPTPPFPVTTTSRLSSSRGTGRNLRGSYEYALAHGSFPAPIRRNRELGVICDGLEAEGHRIRKPEGRGREDDDDAEPRRGVRREGSPRALRGHGSAGQPDDVAGHRPRLARALDVRRAGPPRLDSRGHPAARGGRGVRVDRPCRGRDRDVDPDRPRALAREGAAPDRGRLRLRLHR